MKKVLFGFILILCAIVAQAQKLQVESFKELTMDFSARSYPRLDYSDTPCCIVKVHIISQEVTFESAALFGKPLYKGNNEYWVYMINNAKRLTIKHPDFLPTNVVFADYGVKSLMSNMCYELVLTMPQTPDMPKEVKQKLMMKIKPQDAIVMIDGEMADIQKGYVELGVGDHKYMVVANGYYQNDGIITIKPNSPTMLNVELIAKEQTAAVVSENTERQSDEKTYQVKDVVHEAVDLGLPSGTLWATCNVGASKPEEYGDYFAWGETEPKADYSWETYKWGQSKKTLTKYGKVDKKTTLDLEDDAAHVHWGGDWRMPTSDELSELMNKKYCTWTWTNRNGMKGREIKSKINGNSIFLPAVGWRHGTKFYNSNIDGNSYWTSSVDSSSGNYACELLFTFFDYNQILDGSRFRGHTVRPVKSGTPQQTKEQTKRSSIAGALLGM